MGVYTFVWECIYLRRQTHNPHYQATEISSCCSLFCFISTASRKCYPELLSLLQVGEKHGNVSLFSEVFGENQNENFTQSVESSGKVKSTKAWNSTSKCSKLEMKTQSAPKAGKMHFPT